MIRESTAIHYNLRFRDVARRGTGHFRVKDLDYHSFANLNDHSKSKSADISVTFIIYYTVKRTCIDMAVIVDDSTTYMVRARTSDHA